MIFLLDCACRSMPLWIIVYISHYSEGLGKPLIGPLSRISTCRECIVFNTDQTLAKVYCETDETDDEYSASNVKFEIGLNQYDSIKFSRNLFGLNAYVKPADALHQLNAVCTVFGIHRNMSVKASIYVVDPSGSPHLSADEVLLEGETVNITCTSSIARPPPLLRFLVEDIEIDTNTNVLTTLNDSTGLYSSVSTLHSFKREWGNRNMSCQQLPEVNGVYPEAVSNSVYIVYKYPPSRLDLVIDQGKLSKVITAICTSMFANPVCYIKWESTIKHFKYTQLENHTMRHTTMSIISFNATHEYYGKQIRCRAECQYFKNALANATTIIFAKKPTVVVYSTPALPVPPNTTITLTCVVNANPVGNITWTMVETSNSKSSQTNTCSNASTCTYEMTTSDVQQVYSCYAQNEHGSDEVSFVVVHEHNHKEDLTGKAFGSLGVTIGVSGGTSFLFIVIVVICLYLRRNQARQQLRKEDTPLDQFQPSQNNPDRDEVTHADTDGAEYADIHKTRRERENVVLPSKDMHSCDAMKECLEEAATERSLHLEQPSNEYGIILPERGSSKQPDARGCQSKEDINTTDTKEDNGVSKQKHIINADSTNARIPKLHQ